MRIFSDKIASTEQMEAVSADIRKIKRIAIPALIVLGVTFIASAASLILVLNPLQ